MLRKMTLALGCLLAMAATSQATIIMSTTSTDVGNGFTAYTLHAHADAGETINGVDTPSIVMGTGLPSQVWLNNTGTFKSTTAGDQTPGLWNSAYTPYDSFWFFDATNSLSVGAAFDESNNGIGGVTGLPAGALGAPYTGFGAMGTLGGASGAKSFTVASGKPGIDVDLAQVVLQGSSTALFSGLILTAQGTNTAISNFTVGPVPEPATMSLLGVAMIGGIGFFRRRRG